MFALYGLTLDVAYGDYGLGGFDPTSRRRG